MSFVFLQIEGCHNILVYEIGFKKAALVTNGLIVKVLHNRFFIGQPPGFDKIRGSSPHVPIYARYCFPYLKPEGIIVPLPPLCLVRR